MVCTYCNREGHRASKCPYRHARWRDSVISVIVVMAFIVGWAFQARGHSWYDPDCCGGNDCEPVSAVTYAASDAATIPVLVVTTSLGTKPVTPQTKIRESRDGRMHACIYQGKLICLYMPPAT